MLRQAEHNLGTCISNEKLPLIPKSLSYATSTFLENQPLIRLFPQSAEGHKQEGISEVQSTHYSVKCPVKTYVSM